MRFELFVLGRFRISTVELIVAYTGVSYIEEGCEVTRGATSEQKMSDIENCRI